MAFGRNRKKQQESIDNDTSFEDFDLNALDDDDVMSSSSRPELSYEDDIDDEFDYIGELDQEEREKELESADEEHNKKFNRIMIAGVIIAALIIGGWFMFSQGSVTTNNEEQSQEQEKEEENNNNEEKDDNGGIVVNEQVGSTYSGSDYGSTQNGTGAIMAFNYEYYKNRDGEKARSHYNPDAKSYDGKFIQDNIDNVPEGTTYNLDITPEETGKKYKVRLTLNIPGMEKSVSYDRTIYTMERDGKFYIETMSSAQEVKE